MIIKTLLAGVTAVGLLLSPVAATAAPAVQAKPTTLELDAGGATVKLKKGNQLQIKGKLGAQGERQLTLGLDVFAQVRVGASTWTNIYTRSCAPNSTFTAKLTIDASADLRLYFAGTSVYASATSNIVGVVVI
ncbi:hypothetical protein C8D88_113180 [Lentzea atacamensis]|uniref:Uncharacterized protein n=2 Tax=Lentzea TaxID=165301 RepID=A0A316HWE4_9PSEU|nr:hypothetical protein [Lentzea atacamensis]PWK82587.1 hypothetical protein C8D88_113180 [Lentzea atacamensis]RAS63136.1 hypothetical protein C8D87_107285 [Lentzea atacamensis]